MQEDLIGASSKTSAYAFPEAVAINASATGFARKSGELPIIDTNYSELAPTKAGPYHSILDPQHDLHSHVPVFPMWNTTRRWEIQVRIFHKFHNIHMDF